MRWTYLGAVTLAVSLLSGAAQAAPAVTGDYLEVRSANIFIGACHHEGEMQSLGKEAVLAWNVADGEYRGVSLKGVTAIAVVNADKHLDIEDAKRSSALYINEAATPAQREAFAALVQERAAKALGRVVSIKTAPVSFDASGDMYRIQVPGVAYAKVRKQTSELCCKQPYVLWGKPFVTVKDAKAGYCVSAEYKDKGLLQTWSAQEQNNAYFGQFSL